MDEGPHPTPWNVEPWTPGTTRPWFDGPHPIEPTPLPGKMIAFVSEAGLDDDEDDAPPRCLAWTSASVETSHAQLARIAHYASLVESRGGWLGGYLWENSPPEPLADDEVAPDLAALILAIQSRELVEAAELVMAG